MKSQRKRDIPREVRDVMQRNSVATRRRIGEFAKAHGISGPWLRHMYIAGHIPVTIWQDFLQAEIPVPECWRRATYCPKEPDPFQPFTEEARLHGMCVVCVRKGWSFDPVYYKAKPPPSPAVTRLVDEERLVNFYFN